MKFEPVCQQRDSQTLNDIYGRLNHTFSLDKNTKRLMITMFHEFLNNSQLLGDFSWIRTDDVWDKFDQDTIVDSKNEGVLKPNLNLSLFLACKSIVIWNLNGDKVRGNGLSLTSFLDKSQMELDFEFSNWLWVSNQ